MSNRQEQLLSTVLITLEMHHRIIGHCFWINLFLVAFQLDVVFYCLTESQNVILQMQNSKSSQAFHDLSSPFNTQIPEAYNLSSYKQPAGFFSSFIYVRTLNFFYWIWKLTNIVPSQCFKVHTAVFLPRLDFKIKIEIQMCSLTAGDKDRLWERVKTLKIKIIIKN